MEQKYFEVPANLITGKDLDYLSDMFEWNCGALKKTNEALNQIQDETLKPVLQKGKELFQNNLAMVLEILEQGGLSNE